MLNILLLRSGHTRAQSRPTHSAHAYTSRHTAYQPTAYHTAEAKVRGLRRRRYAGARDTHVKM